MAMRIQYNLALGNQSQGLFDWKSRTLLGHWVIDTRQRPELPYLQADL